MTARFGASDFDPEQPQAFYLLGDGREDMEALADATLLVGGKRLPVHSQVLSLQSAGLRGLFAVHLGCRSGTRGAAGAPAARSPPRRAPSLLRMTSCFLPTRGESEAGGAQGGLVLEEPFRGAALFDTALFLRLCYRPGELATAPAASLAAVPNSLPGLLRLAHKLDAPPIRDAAAASMAEHVGSAAMPLLLQWAAAADHCGLPDLCLRCLSQVARRLASRHGGLADAPKGAGAGASAAAVLGACDKGLLVQLVGLMAETGGECIAAGPPPSGIDAAAEAAADAAAATAPAPGPAVAAELEPWQAANPGSFEWELERFSQQPAAAGRWVDSPWFWAAGRQWCLSVCPGGDTVDAVGHLPVYIYCSQAGTRATVAVTLVDRAAQEPQHVTAQRTLAFNTQGWCFNAFVPLDRLRARPGYLAGDRLLLRARVEVVP